MYPAALILLLIVWSVLSIYLIVTGKAKGKPSKRKLGIGLLVGPLILFFLTMLFASAAIMVVPFVALILLIWAIVYSRKVYKWPNWIPVILPFALILLAISGSTLLLIGYESTPIQPLGSPIGPVGPPSIGLPSYAPAAYESKIGFSTGGAKDIGNFRENIQNNYLPLPSDITYEGLFYDYYFDTGQTQECTKLFCPSYTYAFSEDPFSKEGEYYLQVGLNSGITEFQRKKLNLVIVLDISGSMGSSFSSYYYDTLGLEENPEDQDKSKMEIANEAVVGLIKHLNDDDYFGVVVFDDEAYIGKYLSRVGDTNMEAIKQHILELQDQGGTNMEAGYKTGTELFDRFQNADPKEYENRIIFLTDAMPNLGDLSEEGLLGMTKTNANNGIYTTFIGIGVDFNTELIETMTKIRGANYYSVHSAKEFKERMDDEFEYMVTPLVFDLELTLEAEGYEIEIVYGSPEANEATGQLMKVNTLFPSKQKEGETRGGIVLLKLKKTTGGTIKLKTTYKDRDGKEDGQEVTIQLSEVAPNTYQNLGIRKGILLSRYANVMKHWMIEERKSVDKNQTVRVLITIEDGIVIPIDIPLGRWERKSVELKVTDDYKKIFSTFKNHLIAENKVLKDETLQQEIDLLDLLLE